VSSYYDLTEYPHFSWWCEEYLRHSVDRFAGQAIKWEKWQEDFWNDLLAWDSARNAPYWGSAALVVSRKNGKTQMLAALALYRLLTSEDKSEILLAAASDKQAGRLFDAVIDYLRQAPELSAQVRRREHIGEIVNVATGGKIIRLTSVGEGNDGYNPSLVIADELHGWLTPTRKRVWTSLRTARGARENFQMVTITTAGDASTRASGILGKMIDGNEASGELDRPNDGLTISRNHTSRLMVYNYSAPTTDPSDFPKMKLANPASWVTEDFIREQVSADDLTDAEVLQLHGCVWAETDTTYITMSALQAAQWTGTDPIRPGERVVLGFDGSERNDETWLVAVNMEGKIMPLARWAKPRHAGEDWRVPRADVHNQVELAFSRYDVLEFACDPPGWYAEIDVWTELYGDGVVVMFDTNKPVRMAPACERMRSAINDGEAFYGGELGGVLREHFGNCVTKETSSGIVVIKDDKMSPRKIDGAVASIFGYDRAMWHAANVAPTYRVAGFS